MSARIVSIAAVSAALLALAAAACNSIDGAIALFCCAVAFAALRGLLAVYASLPEHDRAAWLSRTSVRRTAAASAALAVAVSAATAVRR
ncbi:MAG TPA: hypothetical protein VF824_11605 [Thermoanaerobaculia bacterium]